MGNLRQSMTDSEWNGMEREIQREKKLGKPEHGYIGIWVDKLTIKQLKKLKKKLTKLSLQTQTLYKELVQPFKRSLKILKRMSMKKIRKLHMIS